MKKLLFSIILLCSLQSLHAQVRFGFKGAPTLSFNRVAGESDTASFSANGVGLRYQLGPTFDYEFKENHFFSTGLLFTVKRASHLITPDNQTAQQANTNVQYLQVPVTLKLLTEEVGLDTKIYFQFGGTVDFRTAQVDSDDNVVQSFNFADANALLTIGLEYAFGIQTKLYGGIFYQRGLFNIINENIYEDNWTMKNDVLGLELGIIF